MGQGEIFFAIINTVLGILAGLGVSLYFFRAQQITDFNKISDKLNAIDSDTKKISGEESSIALSIANIEKNVLVIAAATDSKKIADMNDSVATLQKSHEKLQSDLSDMSSKIISEVQRHQIAINESIQDEVMRQLKKSRNNMIELLKSELLPLINAKKPIDKTIEDIADNTEHIISTMVRFVQNRAIADSNESFRVIKNDIEVSIERLHSEIENVANKADNLMVMLSAPHGE